MKEKIKHLPKWAQYEFKKMENKIKRLEKTINAFCGKQETNIYIQESLTKHPLPKNSCIKFILPNNTIDIDIQQDTIRIIALNEIAIIPRAANSVYIR